MSKEHPRQQTTPFFMHKMSYNPHVKPCVYFACSAPITASKPYTLISKEVFYRIWYFVFSFVVCCIAAWIYGQEILYLYLNPLYNLSQNIIFTSISEAFSTTLHVCISVALICSIPFCVYLIFCFFLPSLFPKEISRWYIVVGLHMFFYILAFCVCAGYIVPELCSWFLRYGTSTEGLDLCFQAKVSTYVFWSESLYIYVICVLQTPVAYVLFYYKYSINMEVFNNRKPLCILLLLFCAIISPPDLYSQGFLFFIFIAILECITWLCFLQESINLYRFAIMKI